MNECSLHSNRGRLILTATILASGMAFLAATMVAVALPTIQESFDTTISGIQWVVNGYTLSLASLILISGIFGDRYGRKRIFSWGIALFISGSLLSALSRSIIELIAFQAFAGIGAAMMIPGSLSLINICFKDEHRGQAIGLWAGFSGGVAALGPFIGGWIVEAFQWPYIFYFQIPVGILALLVTRVSVPESKDPHPRALDWMGTGLVVFGLFGVAFALIQGPVFGWGSTLVLVALLLGIVSLVTFVIVQMNAKSPMVPFHIFRNPLVAGANLVTFVLYFSLNGLLFFLILNFQQVQNLSPTETGLALLPTFLLIASLSGPAGKLSDKIGPRIQMMLGPLLVAISMALFLLPSVGERYVTHFLPALSLLGFGMALTIAPLTKSALSVLQEYSGLASGINNAISRVAALFAVAVLGAVMTFAFSSALADGIESSALTQNKQEEVLEQSNKVGGIVIPAHFSEEEQQQAGAIIKESFIFGFRWVIGLCALLSFVAVFVSAVFIPSRSRGGIKV